MSPGDPATCQPGLGLAFLPRLLLEVQRRDCVPGAEALSPPLCRDVGLDLSMLLAAASGLLRGQEKAWHCPRVTAAALSSAEGLQG